MYQYIYSLYSFLLSFLAGVIQALRDDFDYYQHAQVLFTFRTFHLHHSCVTAPNYSYFRMQ